MEELSVTQFRRSLPSNALYPVSPVLNFEFCEGVRPRYRKGLRSFLNSVFLALLLIFPKMTVTPQLRRKGVEGVILSVEEASWEDRGHWALQADGMTDVGAAVADGNMMEIIVAQAAVA